MYLVFNFSPRNTASESIDQKLVFAGSEEGKLLALRQSFAEVCCLYKLLGKFISLANWSYLREKEAHHIFCFGVGLYIT